METQIGITKKEITDSVNILNEVLSNEMILLVKTRNFHWNIKGNSFMELHKVTDAQYDQLSLIVDEVAERISKLGSRAIGSMKEFISNATLKESTSAKEQEKMLEILLKDNNQMCTSIREHIKKLSETNDFVTTDFLTGVLEKHENFAWILRSYLS